MKSNQNLPGSSNRRVGNAFGVSGMSGMPLEWLDARSWRLPSGKALAEFALQTGFLAPLLFRQEPLFREDPPRASSASLDENAALRAKALRKGEPR
jgi:hypothetical protein